MGRRRKAVAFVIGIPLILLGVLWSVNYVRGMENEPPKDPAKSVLEQYGSIHKALAADSMAGVPESAKNIATAIRKDAGKSIPLAIAEIADTLARAQDLKAARRAFKPLSASLISWLEENKVEASGYQEAYCPMVDANWLQMEEEIINPYLGKRMLNCGEFDRRF